MRLYAVYLWYSSLHRISELPNQICTSYYQLRSQLTSLPDGLRTMLQPRVRAAKAGGSGRRECHAGDGLLHCHGQHHRCARRAAGPVSFQPDHVSHESARLLVPASAHIRAHHDELSRPAVRKLWVGSELQALG